MPVRRRHQEWLCPEKKNPVLEEQVTVEVRGKHCRFVIGKDRRGGIERERGQKGFCVEGIKGLKDLEVKGRRGLC